MNGKVQLGQDRLDSFEKVVIPNIKRLSAEEIQANWMRGQGLNKARLAEAVGHGCETKTFRQHPRLKDALERFEDDLRAEGKLGTVEAKTTNQERGEANERELMAFIDSKMENKGLWPVDHHGRLYRKALWAEMSGQLLEEVDRIPHWFSSRKECRKKLDSIDVLVVRGELPTVDMSPDSAMDEVTNDMVNPLIQKLQGEVKRLQQELESERVEKLEWKQKAEQLELREKRLMTSAKTPRLSVTKGD